MLSLFTLSEIVELKIFTTGQLSNADLWVQWGLVDGWNVIPDRKRDPENNIHYWFAHIRHAIPVVTLYDDTSLSVATLVRNYSICIHPEYTTTIYNLGTNIYSILQC